MKGILFLIETIYYDQIHMHFSQKKNFSSHFFPPFSKPILNLENFEKRNMNLIPDVFQKLRTPKNVVR